MQYIRLTVSEISSGNETRMHCRTARHSDDIIYLSPAHDIGRGIKKGESNLQPDETNKNVGVND